MTKQVFGGGPDFVHHRFEQRGAPVAGLLGLNHVALVHVEHPAQLRRQARRLIGDRHVEPDLAELVLVLARKRIQGREILEGVLPGVALANLSQGVGEILEKPGVKNLGSKPST